MARLYQSPLGTMPTNDRRGDYEVNQYGEIVFIPRPRRRKATFRELPFRAKCRRIVEEILIIKILTIIYSILTLWALEYAMRNEQVKPIILATFGIVENCIMWVKGLL